MTLMLAALFALQADVRPVLVCPPEQAAQATQPQLAVGRDGQIWLAYGAGGTIYVSTSKDGGHTFSTPVAVNKDNGRMALGMRRGPRIAVNKARVVVSAVFGQQGGGKDGDLLAWRSPNGLEWDGPEEINDVPGSAREGLHAMGAGADDAFVAVWLDLRGKGTKLYGSISSNGGRGWSENRLVYESPDGTICECCHPSLGFGPFGEVGVMFRNSIRGARDMYFAKSPDGGRTWDVATKIGTQTWEVAACPMDGGALSFDGTGSPVCVYRSQDRVYFGRMGAGTELAIGKNPWFALDRNTPVFAWQSGTGVYVQVGTSTATRRRLAETGMDPVVVATRDGALAAWRQGGSSPGVYVQRVSTRG